MNSNNKLSNEISANDDQNQEIKASISVDPNAIVEAQDMQNLGAAILLNENTKE